MRRSFSMPLLLRLPPRGTALVEFALILPFLVVMLVGLCDLGFAAYDALAVQAAAEAGAQYVALNGWNPAAIATVVSGASGAGPITATPAPSQVYGCPDGGFFHHRHERRDLPKRQPAGSLRLGQRPAAVHQRVALSRAAQPVDADRSSLSADQLKPPLDRRIRSHAIRPSGAAAVEFAVVLPILMLCVLGLLEFARLIWTQATLTYAVQAAARCAAVDLLTCGNAAQTQLYAVNQAGGLSLPASNFTVTTQTCGMEVSASLAFTFVLPELLPYSQTLNASACFPN